MIEEWRQAVIESAAFYVGWGGLIIGIVFGFVVQRTNFCTMGSISDILSFGDYRRFRSWLLAGAVAIVGVWWIERAGVADMAESMYLTPSLGWLANIVGGAMFGFGMVYPTFTSYAFEAAGESKGFAASLSGAANMLGGFLTSLVITALYDESHRVISGAMVVAGTLAILIFLVHRRRP